jgi:hypothetical protein
MARVLVCGDRYWTDKEMIKEKLSKNKDNIDMIIEGGANGADRLASECAKELGIPVMEFPANWKKYGRAAGPIRNRQMLDEGKPEVVLAFHDDITKSKGTKNMVEQARKRNKTVYVYTHNGPVVWLGRTARPAV